MVGSNNLDDAKQECSKSETCRMFFYRDVHDNTFYSCDNSTTIEASSIDTAVLHIKKGNKTNTTNQKYCYYLNQ